ncbi:MAG: GatB/YqeY domain-containing protein [Deltaproteobacteria bacterium]|nr:GatB/YqeY domain-containing protein [Deltaproteobacteria bacterium]
MALKEDITEGIKTALKVKETLRLSTLRMLLSAVKYKEIDLRRPLEDVEIQQIVATLIKQRHDSIEQFEKGGRIDLADKERAEAEVLKTLLPPQMSADEIKEAVKAVAIEIGASNMKDMGRLMKETMARLKGKADGKAVNEAVKKALGG